MSKRVAIFGPFGFGNLGDAATQEAVIENLKSSSLSYELCAISLNPEDTQKRHNLPTWIIRRHGPRRSSSQQTAGGLLPSHGDTSPRFAPLLWVKKQLKTIPGILPLKRLLLSLREMPSEMWREAAHIFHSYRWLRDVDLLLISGGGQLDEYWGGPWEHPYAMFKWCVLARLAKAKVAFVSVGVGSIDHRSTRWLIRAALACAKYRSFRDRGSQQMVENRIGCRLRSTVVPDLAYSLPVSKPEEDTCASAFPLTVGIGPMSYFYPLGWAWPEKDAKVYGQYIDKLAALVSWLLKRNYRILFYTGELRHDRLAIEDVKIRLAQAGEAVALGQMIDNKIESVPDLLRELQQTDIVIGSRFHGVLLPHLLGKPVIALSYERKVKVLMDEMGHADYCFDIDTFDLGAVQSRFDQLVKSPEAIRQVIHRIEAYRDLLRDQYETVLQLA